MKRSIFSLLCVVLLASACNKKPWDEKNILAYYSNIFAYNMMDTYYLWRDEPEIAREIDNWNKTEDAIQKVKSCLYEADKWTWLYDNYAPFEQALTGSGKTFGLDYSGYYANAEKTEVEAVVEYTYADSPARKAGLERGDEIITIDGEILTPDNYGSHVSKFYYNSSIQLGLSDGRTVQLEAADMYENPVHTVSTFERNGVKYGYLHFTNFTLDACKDLESVFAQFKAEGIQELVLDLRYNGGGYITTATVLASMIAPPSAVSQEKVFNKDVYNKNLTESLEEEVEVRFAPEITYTSDVTHQIVTVKPLDVNPGIKHLWVLVTYDSASASEAIICGLKPYMDVTVVGEKTYGKFCGGVAVGGPEWFSLMEKYNGFDSSFDYDEARETLDNWGIYVINSRYADCNGETLSMPDGITPDIAGSDDPFDGFQLGDPSETLLATALGAVKSAPATPTLVPLETPYHRPGFGVLLH